MTAGHHRLHAAVVAALAAAAGCDAGLVTGTTTLDELGLDSLDLTSVLLDVEERLGAHLPLEALAEAADVRPHTDVATLVQALSAGTGL